MFSSDANYAKLKTHLRLAINRLKLLEKKKSELAQKARKEIADYIAGGKYERAKIRVESIIREDYMVEAMELLEIYCDLLLSRFGLLQQMKTLDPSLAEPVSSLLWVAPHLNSDVGEMKVISDQLTAKFGKKYTEACRAEAVDTISEKLKHKLNVQSPPRILVEKYLIEIAKNYNIPYEPDTQVMREEEQAKGMDALLFDGGSNNLGGDPRPAGFVGYPQPPLMPDTFSPFSYPSPSSALPPPTAPVPVAKAPPDGFGHGVPFSYNIPPSADVPPPSYDQSKRTNVPTVFPQPSNNNSNRDSNKQSNLVPKPTPRSKLAPDSSLPDLPAVPSDIVMRSTPPPDDSNADDIDFDDLARRFEELKKRK